MGSVCFGKLIESSNLVSFIDHTFITVLEIGNKDHHFLFLKNANLLIMIQRNGDTIWYALTCYQMQYLSTKMEA